ncbi:MAG: acyl-CoA thioesterase [Alphaproteobacteria bacterium]|nr:acyl-CoA thioesterase [Rhodospirillales bacterium]MCW9045786.1 acyl-CoA thioesterase [Alphaproteobacteria bacterium]
MATKKPFVHKSPVRFTHTDPAGYVFFPRFFEMFQAAVEDWFNEGLEVDYAGMVNNLGLGLPTAKTECTFMRPCKLGEMLELSVILEKIGTSSISLRFDGHVNGELRLQAKSVLVVISLETGKAEPISDDLRTRLSWFSPA